VFGLAPAFIYSTASGNPGGYWHWSHLLGEDVRHYPTGTLAYANNVVVARPRVFDYFDLGRVHPTLAEFRNGLAEDGALASQTGWAAHPYPVVNAEAHDFRPKPDSAVGDRGVRFFVPWGLGGVVGEWQLGGLILKDFFGKDPVGGCVNPAIRGCYLSPPYGGRQVIAPGVNPVGVGR
jgi:hypothetical protein